MKKQALRVVRQTHHLRIDQVAKHVEYGTSILSRSCREEVKP